MAKWPKAKLADCVDLVAGFAFKSQHFTDRPDYIPLVKGENVSQGCILWDISKRWPARDWPEMEKFQLHPGDVVVAMDRPWVPAGLKWAYIRKDDPKALLVQRCARLRSNNSKLDQGFLRFVIGEPGFENYVKPITTGVNVPHISGRQILDYELTLPPLSVQCRIAGILSAYDDLIENCQRRIHILEKLARALYREWFVKFRFPGNEKFKRVPSPLGEIPEGWEVTTLGEHLDAIESGKRPIGGIRDVENGVPSIGAENINGIGWHNFAGEKFVSREYFQRMRKGIVHDRDIAVYKDGAYIGKSSYFRDGFPYIECCVNEHVFLLRSSEVKLNQNTLYLWLQEPDTIHAIRATNANAAQPGINQQSMNGIPMILPDKQTAMHFDQMVEPLLGGIINFSKQIRTLRRTRGLLLPRLLSGQVDLGEAEP